MPRKITPAKSRGGKQIIMPGRGEARKAGNPDIDPEPPHRCQVCHQTKPDCVRQVYPPTPARWTCQACLRAAGQLQGGW